MIKKYFLMAFISMFIMQGCTTHDDYTIIEEATNPVIEITTTFSASNSFKRLVTISPPIYNSDLILVYHLYDVYQGTDIWRLMPQKYYLENNRELDYNFDFTKYDVSLFLEANFDMTTLDPVWTNNQTFRIMILPGYFSKKSTQNVNFEDYNATMKAFNINPLNIKKIKL